MGTSGFSYPTWKPDFYPPKTPQKAFLHAYGERLPSVELNATFYQLPSEERLRAWADQTPPAFRFAVKMNRRATHFGDVWIVFNPLSWDAHLLNAAAAIVLEQLSAQPQTEADVADYLSELVMEAERADALSSAPPHC